MRRAETPTRRRNPNGEIKWVARYTDQAGQRRTAPKPGTFKLKGPCKKRLDTGECCAQHRIWWAYGQEAPASTETVRWYYETTWLQRHPRAKRTQESYQSRLRAALEMSTTDGTFGDLAMRSVRSRHLDDLVHQMLVVDGRAASGTRAVISAIGAMFRDAMRDEVADMNPSSLVTVRDADPRVQKQARQPKVVRWPEAHAFARAAGEHELLIRVLSDCGLRVGEMLGLECKHIRGDTLVVEQRVWDGEVLPGTKQGLRREVPLPPALAGMLRQASKDRIGLLFPKPSGDVWWHREFYRLVWTPAVQRTGLAINPHDLRHSHISQLRAAGIDPADLARVSGHTLETATRVYTHALDQSDDLIRSLVG